MPKQADYGRRGFRCGYKKCSKEFFDTKSELKEHLYQVHRIIKNPAHQESRPSSTEVRHTKSHIYIPIA